MVASTSVQADRSGPLAPALHAASRRRGDEEFGHLAPLFDECKRLPDDHPDRRIVRDRLVTGHLPLARRIARRYAHRDTVDDLEQVAVVGLIQAVDRFDPDRGVPFLSFAVPTISGEVLRHLRDRARTVRMPRKSHDLRASLHRAADELCQRLGRAPRPSELAAFLGVDVEAVISTLQACETERCASLDEPAWADEGRAGRTRFDRSLACWDQEIDLVEYRLTLGPLLARLPDRERRILLLRFFVGMTQSDIAAQVGVSQMHVSRLLASVLAQLREHLTDDG